MYKKKQKLIEKLNAEIKNCTACQLSTTRNHVLCGEGDIYSRMMLVALSPGEKEDEEDRMFIGPSGEVLNKFLNNAGVKRKFIYMTNLIKCMLPKNRKPKMNEIQSCSRFLDKEISIMNPAIIVPLGFY